MSKNAPLNCDNKDLQFPLSTADNSKYSPSGGGRLSILGCKGRLRPKGVPFLVLALYTKSKC